MSTTIFADTEYRGSVRRFGMTDEERLRGVLILGKAGMGKTQLVVSLALQDIASGLPVVLIDADGTAIREISRRIPESRIADVVRYDPRESADAIDLGSVASSRPIILADLSRVKDKMGARGAGQLLEATYAYALGRDGGERALSLSLFLDAAGGIIQEQFALFLRDARSLGIGVTLAARYWGEFSSTLQESFVNALATLGLFQLSVHDARHFGETLSPHLTPSLLASLSPGMLGTNLMVDQGTLPVVVARGATASGVGFAPREQSFESFPSVVRKQMTNPRILNTPEIPTMVLEAYLDVGFAH